jgi:hypothetical protein
VMLQPGQRGPDQPLKALTIGGQAWSPQCRL